MAWNGSIEAAHSLRLTLSFLRVASEVHIVNISSDNNDFPPMDASRYLARHGIGSQLHEWPQEGCTIAQTLLDAAGELAASSLVMGAYGHSRLRETVLGGVTRDLLSDTSVPLLLAH
ncbi:universal stress protein [Sphingobium sp. Ant17]|uniref:universal stress protein n=2 Tax=unclassified Sphingobium TaxID=2611147 RepID=UPI0004B13492|nr:universal stress protein [Sphingobium sp. Ant17]